MNKRYPIIIAYGFPCIIGVISLCLMEWHVGGIIQTSGGIKITDMYVKIGINRINFDGYYGIYTEHSTYSLRSMDTHARVSAEFKNDWKKIYQVSSGVIASFVAAFVFSFLVFFRKFFYLFAILPSIFYWIAIISYLVVSDNVNKIIFNDKNAMFPIYIDTQISNQKEIKIAMSVYLAIGTGLLSILSYIIAIRLHRKG
ncbi:hypothetical protein M0811_10214 [Anaeramoeba ignava]|uniref:Uncharacterized protein n=1 Tax=Anaeramoeba ignava TaxID=1746090 RepID=A0A9Q0LEU5_ANAIG|nr:hypothetical protein M0811_10214 [Anaeramoeba ignava]